MIRKTDHRILQMMLEKTVRLMEIYKNHSKNEIINDYTLSDSIQYEFEKLYEDATRLSMDFISVYGNTLHIDELRGIRNRVAHNYEKVSINILLDTIENDIPLLNQNIQNIIADLEK